MIMFGFTFAFYVFDVFFYIYAPVGQKAQLGLVGFLHIYLYFAAIWASCLHGFGIFWIVGDIVFILVSIAAAALSQTTISLFCVNKPVVWQWNGDLLAYVPPSVASTDSSTIKTLLMPFLMAECGSSAIVSALAAILV